MELFFTLIYVLIASAALWWLKYRRSNLKEKTVYVCNLCGENHCECTQE